MDKSKCFQFSPRPKSSKSVNVPKAPQKQKQKLNIQGLEKGTLRRNETVFNPDGPDHNDFTEEEIRKIHADSHDSVAPIRHDHEWEHLTSSCGCVFNKEMNRRLIACDKLILQDRFLESEQENLPYTAMDKLLKIAEALDARQYLYPSDENQRDQLLTLWSFAYELSTSSIAELTANLSPNY